MMNISEPPQGFVAIIQEYVACIYKTVIADHVLIYDDEIRQLFCQLLAELPAKTLNELTVLGDDDITAIFIIRLELIADHGFSLSSINPFTDSLYKG